MDIGKMYSACIKFPQVAGDIEFRYSEMEIVKKYHDSNMQDKQCDCLTIVYAGGLHYNRCLRFQPCLPMSSCKSDHPNGS